MKKTIFSLFNSLLRPLGVQYRAAVDRSPGSDVWYNIDPTAGISKAGPVVDADTAMHVSTVNACVRVLCETVGMLPLLLYRELQVGKEKAIDDPVYRMFHTRKGQVNPWTSSQIWREIMMLHLALRGKAYSQIVPVGAANQPYWLIPLSPDRMQVERNGAKLEYKYTLEDGTKKKLEQEEVMSLVGLTFDGVHGLSVISYYRESMGLSLATEAYGSRFFGRNATPRTVIRHPGTPTTETKEKLARQWMAAYGNPEVSHGVAILEEGSDITQMSVNNDDSQFLETRKFQVRDICRAFRMPPHMVQDLEDAHQTNIEHDSINFVRHTMMPWFVRFESALTIQFPIGDDLFFEFNLDALLRTTTKERFEAHNMAIYAGWKTRNQIRVTESLNPGPPELDEYLDPQGSSAGAGNAEPQNMPRPPSKEKSGALAAAAVDRLIKLEKEAIRKAAVKHPEGAGSFKLQMVKFYDKYGRVISESLLVPACDSDAYCNARLDVLTTHGIPAIEQSIEESRGALMSMAFTE